MVFQVLLGPGNEKYYRVDDESGASVSIAFDGRYNSLFGDPNPGYHKTLTIVLANGAEFIADEGCDVVMTVPRRLFASAERHAIRSAHYYNRDVTSAVRKIVDQQVQAAAAPQSNHPEVQQVRARQVECQC